jgi:hypothetical protein
MQISADTDPQLSEQTAVTPKKEKSILRGLQSIIKPSSSKSLAANKGYNVESVKVTKFLTNKPYHFDYWIRSMDYHSSIYYYNVLSGDTAWLAPCSSCYKPSDKYCLQCNACFCDRHFIKKHKNGVLQKDTVKQSQQELVNSSGSDGISFLDHEYSSTEFAKRQPLQENEVYCLECQLNVASVLCDSCWDSFCVSCFSKIHRIGSLRRHKMIEYHEAKSGWFMIRGNQLQGTPDIYINGATKAQTLEKPRELMNEVEGLFYEKWKTYQNAATQLTDMIETLQFELEKALYERDKMTVEIGEMTKNFNTKVNNTAENLDIQAVFGSNQSNQSEYRQILLNPSDRKRGQARTKYIKSLLELPFPT